MSNIEEKIEKINQIYSMYSDDTKKSIENNKKYDSCDDHSKIKGVSIG